MASDDDVWRDYAARVKRVAGKKSASKLVGRKKRNLPQEQISSSPLEGEVRWGGMPQYQRLGLWMAPSPDPSLKGEGRIISPTSFDRKIERQLRCGAIRIDATLDLHGMTQAVAHEALAHFMAAHIKRGSRKLLIVTGKGRGNAGVLKTSLRGWLSDLPLADRIIDLRPAALKHGGDGAFYVWLKKGMRC